MLSPLMSTLYALIPMSAAFIGGFLASLYTPKAKIISTLQHFVAGIVIGAVAIELLPKILGHLPRWTISLGFMLGAILNPGCVKNLS